MSRARTRTEPSADKSCAVCGRAIAWRKKWADDWDEVRYCSAACRRRGLRAVDGELEAAYLRLLGSRADGATICPSEIARDVAPGPEDQDWRPLMEPARAAARRLVSGGTAEITQRGQVVDRSSAKGPIRVRLVRRG